MNKKINLLILFLVLIYFVGINNQLGLFGDNAGYIIWTKSMLNGGGLNYINEPSDRDSGFNIYVFPIILIPFVKYFYPAYWCIKLFLVILFFAAVYVFNKYLTLLKIKNDFKMPAVLLLVVNPLMFRFSHSVMSEIPFLLFSLLGIYFIDKNQKIQNLLFGLLFFIISYFTRKAGLIFFVSLPLYYLLKRKYKNCIIVIVLILGFMYVVAAKNYQHMEKGDRYLSIFLMKSQYSPDEGKRNLFDIIKLASRQFAVYTLKITPDTFFYPLFKKVKFDALKNFNNLSVKKILLILFPLSKLLLGLLLSIIIFTGFLYRIINKIKFSDVYTIITFCVLLLWQIGSSRYLLPVLPFLIIYFLSGIKLIFKTKFKIIIITIFCICSVLIIKLTFDYRNNYIPQNWKDYYATVKYFDENNISNQVVACRKPLLYYLKSNEKMLTLNYPMTNNDEHFLDFFKKNNIKYLVKDNFFIGIKASEKYLIPILNKYNNKFKRLLKINKTELYEFIPEN